MGKKLHTYILSHLIDEYAFFSESYQPIFDYDSTTFKQPQLLDKDFRRCRFCKKKKPDVSFTKIAHVIPELLGSHNRYISDFECNSCNEMFQNFENELGWFLNLEKTLHGVKGKEGYTTFKNHQVRAGMTSYSENENLFTVKNLNEPLINLDKDKGSAKIIFDDKPYVPIKVYKALLKIALGCLPVCYGDVDHPVPGQIDHWVS